MEYTLVELCVILIFGLTVLYKVVDRLLRIPRLKFEQGRKNLLITGCDTGFGNAFAKRMDKDGFQVFACCLSDSGRLKLQQECSGRVKAIVMDVSQIESVESGLKFVQENIFPHEGIWAVVNNAGIVGVPAPADLQTLQLYRRVLDVNYFGTVNVCTVFLPLLKMGKGRIVNTSSIVGRIALPSMGPYASSKYAVEGYSDSLRRDMRRFGVSVHLVEPGFFQTPISDAGTLEATLQLLWKTAHDDVKKEYGDDYVSEAMRYVRDNVSKCSADLSPVLNAYEHAVTAVYPRARYMPGWTAWLILWPISLMPEWLSDVLLTPKSKQHHKNN